MTEQDLFSSRVNVNNLGYFLDGWADLIEGMGDKENEVRLNVLNGLKERGIQGVDVGGASGVVSITANETRSHTLAVTDPGATTAIYIGKSGKDLYAAWRTFINPVLN